MYTLGVEEMLKKNGHETAVFAMKHPDNIPTEWDKYFASEVSFAGGIKDKLRAVRRMMGRDSVVADFNKLLDDFKPDVVHLNNIHSYLSPVLAKLAKKRGIKVVWTLHDYKLMCPSYSRLDGVKPCDKCHEKGSLGGASCVVKQRCMKGSLMASAIGAIEALRWPRAALEPYVDTFICPSQFMADEMAKAGYDKSKLTVLNNSHNGEMPRKEREQYYCFVGRLSHEKGADTLLQAAAKLPYELRIGGGGPLAEELKAKYAEYPQIKFLGFLNGEQVGELFAGAQCSVIPSEWYENNPLSVIEALSAGTPVVGTKMGGIPELIDENSGMTVEPFDADALANAIETTIKKDWDHELIRKNAVNRFNSDNYYQKLSEIYAK